MGISTVRKARFVLEYTGADALMIGQGAQGRPWIFRNPALLETGNKLAPIEVAEQRQVMLEHLTKLYDLYGEYKGIASPENIWDGT